MICYAKCFNQLDYGWLFNSGLLFSVGRIVNLFQKMSCCLSPRPYLNRFELLSLLRMKAFFPFKLQIDLILFSFIQDARRSDSHEKTSLMSFILITCYYCLLYASQHRASWNRTNDTAVKVLCLNRLAIALCSSKFLFPCPCYIVYYTHLKTIVKNYF